jgi:endonuclease/exonuclease/phosphatase family metal-dependent hydrolase
MKSNYPILILVLMLAFNACSTSKPGSKENPINVLSYNIHHANPPSKPGFIDLPAIAQVIKESGADLVALQEVDVFTDRSGKNSNQAEELAKLVGMEFFFSKGIDYQGGEYGTAILSKFPILDDQRYELPNVEGVNSEPRTLAVVTVEVNGEKVKFANTHLDFTNAENNLLQVKKIMDIFKDETLPVIMGGDFNAVPESASIQLLDEQFTRSCSQDCPFTSPQQNPQRIIDYIMVSSNSNFETIDHQVIAETYASDHRPVLAVYRFKK